MSKSLPRALPATEIYRQRPTNKPEKIPHHTTASPDSRSTASQMRFATGTAPPHCQSGAEKKESTGHHLSPACRPCATPSSLSFFGHQIRDARTAEDRSAKSNGVNKSAKVVLI